MKEEILALLASNMMIPSAIQNRIKENLDTLKEEGLKKLLEILSEAQDKQADILAKLIEADETLPVAFDRFFVKEFSQLKE